MAITHEQIIEVADALVAAGQNPTMASVRKALGGGSFTTISEALKAWRQTRQEERIRAEIIDIPPSLQQAFEEAGRLVWKEATAQHAAKLAEERQALEDAHDRYENERNEAVDAADQISAELEQTLAALEREQSAHADTQRNLMEARQEIERVLAKGRELEARVEERGRQVTTLESELAAARGELAAAGEQKGRMDGQLQSAEELRTRLQADLTQARTALAELQGEVKLKVSEAAAAKEQTTAERKARIEFEHQAAQLRDQLGELRVQVAQLTERTAHFDDLRALIPTLESPSTTKGARAPRKPQSP
ncbi:DNA-binding protein [Thiocapsa roseopersicina]|uniref:Replication region DNA-binding N-term n=1 Tax=Thiocapsa roseopersicina TaxID=1058 RepID=A0A1H3BTY2_THIRO|nr:DNA-binding protein [Thiocapsa roseopersicina]SDX45276.1 replication region DNA-binding N-term [Thiocapsa roseopersicina]